MPNDLGSIALVVLGIVVLLFGVPYYVYLLSKSAGAGWLAGAKHILKKEIFHGQSKAKNEEKE